MSSIFQIESMAATEAHKKRREEKHRKKKNHKRNPKFEFMRWDYCLSQMWNAFPLNIQMRSFSSEAKKKKQKTTVATIET